MNRFDLAPMRCKSFAGGGSWRVVGAFPGTIRIGAESKRIGEANRKALDNFNDARRVQGRRVVRLLNFVAKSTSNVSLTVVDGATDQCLTATFTLSAAILFLLASSIT